MTPADFQLIVDLLFTLGAGTAILVVVADLIGSLA